MNVTASENAARTERVRSASAGTSHWWKAWVLLTSVGATALGWMALDAVRPPTDTMAAVAPQVQIPTGTAPVVRVTTPARVNPPALGVGALSAMPQKPVFQAPVTRTRRS